MTLHFRKLRRRKPEIDFRSLNKYQCKIHVPVLPSPSNGKRKEIQKENPYMYSFSLSPLHIFLFLHAHSIRKASRLLPGHKVVGVFFWNLKQNPTRTFWHRRALCFHWNLVKDVNKPREESGVRGYVVYCTWTRDADLTIEYGNWNWTQSSANVHIHCIPVHVDTHALYMDR